MDKVALFAAAIATRPNKIKIEGSGDDSKKLIPL
jgi:hypothetical protein